MRRLLLFVAGFIVAFLVAYSVLAVDRPVEGVTTIRLAKCELDIYDKTLQPVVTLACPEKDTMRIWLLPVVQPWWEEKLGVLAGSGDLPRLRIRLQEVSAQDAARGKNADLPGAPTPKLLGVYRILSPPATMRNSPAEEFE
jgi:hypothetical protein